MKSKVPKGVLILSLLAFFLLVQFVFSLKIKEPYPAIIFPGFGNVHKKTSEVEISKYTILVQFLDQKDTLLDADLVFCSFPNWYVPRVCERLLYETTTEKETQDRRVFEQWLARQTSTIIQRSDIYTLELSKNIHRFSLQQRKIIGKEKVLSRVFNLKEYRNEN